MVSSFQHKAICCHFTQKPSVICDVIQVYSGAHGRTMVFTGTKAEANELALNAVLKQECQVREYNAVLLVLVLILVRILALLI